MKDEIGTRMESVVSRMDMIRMSRERFDQAQCAVERALRSALGRL